MLLGCLGEAPLPELSPGPLERPQAIRYAGGVLVVGNTAFEGGDAYGEGSIAILDAEQGTVLHRVPTSAPNPMRLRLSKGRLYAVSAGVIGLEDPDAPSATAGAVDVFEIDRLAEGAAPVETIPVPAAETFAAPVDLAFSEDAALLSSGLQNAVRPLAGGAPRIYGETPRLGLGSLAPWDEGFLVADFNSDTLHVLDAAGTATCAVDVGEAPMDLEGLQSIAVVKDRAYLLMALSGVIRVVDLSSLEVESEGCGVQAETLAGPLGSVPNELRYQGGRLYVVDSGDNAVTSYDPESGEALQRWALPPGSQPWHIDFDPQRPRAALSLWGAQDVAFIDLEAPDPLAELPELPGEGAWADVVVSAQRGEGPFGDPERAANGVRGGGQRAGGRDVFSLGVTGPAASIVLGWSGRRVVDGPGPDFAVFENPFDSGGGRFMDPLVVELSVDGQRWVPFPHDYSAPEERAWSEVPEHWSGFAGVEPVRINVESNPVDPLGDEAGGDAFDLALVEDPEIREEGFVYLRLTSAQAHTNPDTDAPYPAHPVGNGGDVDGVWARNFRETSW